MNALRLTPMVQAIMEVNGVEEGHAKEYEPNGRSLTVSALPFHYPEDSIESRIAEAVKKGGTISEVIQDEIAGQEMVIMCEGVNAVLGIIMTSDRPKLAAYQIAFASGLNMALNLSMEQTAKQFGITKQAVQQGVEKIRQKLGLRKTRTMRSDNARRRMALSNHRHQSLKAIE